MGLPWASTKHEFAAATTILRATKSKKATRIGIAFHGVRADYGVWLVSIAANSGQFVTVICEHGLPASVVVVPASVVVALQNEALA
jgi:hypothetical protein